MDSYTVTTLVGGTEGDFFSDILKLTGERGQLIVDKQNAIRRIDVSSGWVVDGLAVWYGLQNSDDQVSVEQGSQFASPDSVRLEDTEVLLAVFGRAGYQPNYKRDLVISIGFVIIDKVSLAVRVVGPFGNEDPGHVDPGEPFYVTDVMALGGYAQATTNLGLSGLIFYKPIPSQ